MYTRMEVRFFEPCEIAVETAVFPYKVNGGDNYIKSAPPKAKFCVKELKGSVLAVKKTVSFTFSDGISLKSDIGVNLSALTGYSKSASISYTYTANGFGCGTKNFPFRDNVLGIVADAKMSGNK